MSYQMLNPDRIRVKFESNGRILRKQQWENLTHWSESQITGGGTFNFDEMIANIQHDDYTIRVQHQRTWMQMLNKAAFVTKPDAQNYGPSLEKFRAKKYGNRYAAEIRLFDITKILIEHRAQLVEWYALQKSRAKVKSDFDKQVEEYEIARRRYKNRLTTVNAPSPIFGISEKMPKDEVNKRMLEWDALNPKPTRKVEQAAEQVAEQVAEPVAELLIEAVEVDDWEQLDE
jgi:hypothetical protein